MVLFSNDFSFLLFIFPGFLYSTILLFVWLVYSNFILQKIDKNQEITLYQIVFKIYEDFNNSKIEQKYSKGFFFLVLEFVIFLLFQILIMGEFFGLNKYNGYFLIFLLLMAILFEVFYQLDLTSNVLVFAGKIFSQFIILICLVLLLISQKETSFSDLSTNLANNINLFHIGLLLVIAFSMSKLSTYMDYKKIPALLSTPNDVSVYNHIIETGNLGERYFRWVTESFSQVVSSQLLVFILFPLIEQLLQLNGPIWVQFFIFSLLEIFILLMSLSLNLLNSILEFKLPNPQSKSIIFILLLLMVIFLT